MHNLDGERHAGGALVLQGAPPVHYLVQQAHQCGEIAQDGLLIIALRLGGIGGHQVQNILGGLMQLLVQGLQLTAQLVDGGVVHAGLSVEPLAQHAGGGVLAAGELGTGVQGVAQIAGPLVMGHLGGQRPVQHGAGLNAALLGSVYPNDVDRNHDTE